MGQQRSPEKCGEDADLRAAVDSARFFDIGTPGRESHFHHVHAFERRSDLTLEAAEQAFWPGISISPQKRWQSDSIVGTCVAVSDVAATFDIYSELCSEYTEDGELSDW